MHEITITEIKFIGNTPEGAEVKERIKRLEMTLDELDLQSVIKAITIPKRKRNAKKAV